MHGENPGQGHLLFFAAGKVERLTIHQMRNLQMLQGFFHAGGDLFSRKAQIFQSKGDFIRHFGTQNLPFRILQDGADQLRDMGQRKILHLRATDQDFP